VNAGRQGQRHATADGDETRRALLDAAHGLLATEGSTGLTVRRIAATAGVSTMNVYFRFGGKDGVVDELFIDGFRQLSEQMAVCSISPDPITALLACGRAYRSFAREHPTHYSLMFDRPVPDFTPAAVAVDAALAALGIVGELVRRAMDQGVARRNDPLRVAAGLWACNHGLASLEARTTETGGDPSDWDHIGNATLAALLRGLET
jgi:AcrR family transcriptional regulator